MRNRVHRPRINFARDRIETGGRMNTPRERPNTGGGQEFEGIFLMPPDPLLRSVDLENTLRRGSHAGTIRSQRSPEFVNLLAANFGRRSLTNHDSKPTLNF